MSAIERIAYHMGRRDEVPNQELARELAEAGDTEGVADIAAHLDERNKSIASDCVKVLYEVGYIDPSLIAPHTDTFIDLLGSRQNRMVWGAMIALWTVADSMHASIWDRIGEVLDAVDGGSVITVDSGVKTLSVVASKDTEYGERLQPVLFQILRECEPKRLAKHAEDVIVMVNDDNREEFLGILDSRQAELTEPQKKRLYRVIMSIDEG